MLIGVIDASPVGFAFQDDGGVFTDFSTECNEATTNDCDPFPATPEAEDAFYLGHATKQFAQIQMTSTTQGSTVMTVLWEYYDGDSWETLTMPRQDVVDFDETTGTYFNNFLVPSDWATVEIKSQTAYWVRARISAFTSVTTQALLGQAWLGLVDTGTGFNVPFNSTLVSIGFTAATVSGTNQDSAFTVLNLTQGTQTAAVFAKTTIVDFYDVADLAFTAGDELVVLQLWEDGTTEHANVNMTLFLER